jgi:hypothetical protein
MRADPEGRFEGVVAAYAVGDLELAASYFSESCWFAIDPAVGAPPAGGARQGRYELLKLWTEKAHRLDVIAYTSKPPKVADLLVRAQIAFAFRHRASGDVIEGVARVEAEFREGKIAVWREIHDENRMRAFMRMCDAKVLIVGARPPPNEIASADEASADVAQTGFDAAHRSGFGSHNNGFSLRKIATEPDAVQQ